jgi:hypothetical protein
LRLAVPIPKILDRAKQASFPSTLVLGSILGTTLCHGSECLSGSQTFGAHQKTLLSSQQDIHYAQLKLNFQVQAAFQSNV